MATKRVTKKVSQQRNFMKGDLVWLSGMHGTNVRDDVYRVEDITHRHEATAFPDSSLLKLRLILKVFYSWERDDGFHWYDELNCSLLEVNHIEELKARFGKIIEDIYALYTENVKERKSASTDSTSKRTRKRKTMESKSDGPKKNGGGSKKAL